jgi:hypothetical protein
MAEKSISAGPQITEIQKELQAKKIQLHWLLQITKAINYNFSTKQLLDVYEHVLHSQLKVEKFALLINDDQWKCAILSGTGRRSNTKGALGFRTRHEPRTLPRLQRHAP